MADADVDGEHIKTLLLTFLFRFMPHLIENGNVYAAMTPLYRVRKGQKDKYVILTMNLKRLCRNQRVGMLRGLRAWVRWIRNNCGTQLWDPEKRTLKRIFIEDAVEADRVFTMLMGSEVQERKMFIQENAREANLDI